MKPTFNEALAVCIQHYVDRGYSEEHASDYVMHATFGIFWLYDMIQKETELEGLAPRIAFETIAEEGDNNERNS